jgi:electron transfer flavoprotein alpha subunit
MAVLVWVEQAGGEPVASCLEVLGKGKELAGVLGSPLAALVMGKETQAVAEAAGRYGAQTVYTVTSPLLAHYRLSTYVEGLKQAVAAAGASVVLTSATQRGRELCAAAAYDVRAGLAPDAIDLRVEAGKLVAVRSVYSNNILTDITFGTPIQFASVRPRSFPMPEPGSGSAELKPLELGLEEAQIPEKVLEVKSSESGEVSLTDARIIVSGGRGVAADPAKGFALVAELATVLGAAMGASRAAVDAGYVPYKHQVGQTGKTVKPDLYIAAGISGAIQHLAGMGGSKVIVAINKDREAPIFERAHYGIIGDLYEVLPALTAEFKKRLGR